MNQKKVDKQARLFRSIFTNGIGSITAILKESSDDYVIEREKILLKLDEELIQIAEQSDGWLRNNIPSVYKGGGLDVYQYLRRWGVSKVVYSMYDQEVVNALLDNSQVYVNNIVTGIRRSSSRILTDMTTERVKLIIENGRLDNAGLRDLKRLLTDYLDSEGIKIQDSAGRRWNVEDYSEMYARTDIMNSYNQGVVNQMLQDDWDLGKITSYPSCECDVCKAWEDKIVSISGKSKKYPALEKAYADGVFHPNCRHIVRPYVE